MTTTKLYKAASTGERHAPDLRIEATTPITEDVRPFSGMTWEAESRQWFDAQAVLFVDAMTASLPGGTVDSILCELLRRKASHFIVPHVEPSPQGGPCQQP